MIKKLVIENYYPNISSLQYNSVKQCQTDVYLQFFTDSRGCRKYGFGEEIITPDYYDALENCVKLGKIITETHARIERNNAFCVKTAQIIIELKESIARKNTCCDILWDTYINWLQLQYNFKVDSITQSKDFMSSKNFSFNLINQSAMQEEYLGILIYIFFAIFLSCLIVALSYFLVTQNPETEKLSTYECGFEPYGDTREQFNVRFYIIAILFILFDIEIILMLPWCVSISQINLLGFWSVVEFLIELSIGFVFAWSVGAIKWN